LTEITETSILQVIHAGGDFRCLFSFTEAARDPYAEGMGVTCVLRYPEEGVLSRLA
jgi:hypothetical protein